MTPLLYRFYSSSLFCFLFFCKANGQPIVKVPSFFIADSVLSADTTFMMTYYSRHPAKVKNPANRDSTYEAIPPHRRDTTVQKWHDFTQVKFVSVFKKYTDYSHHYRANNDKELPLPVSTIIKRYERLGINKWIFIDYASRQFKELKEYPDEIIRRDTITGKGVMPIIYEYYKVAELP